MWLDGDGDGKWSSAEDYANKAVSAAGTDWRKAAKALSVFDEATAAQAAGLLRAAGVSPSDKDVRAAAKAASEQVLRGFDAYAEALPREPDRSSTRGAARPAYRLFPRSGDWAVLKVVAKAPTSPSDPRRRGDPRRVLRRAPAPAVTFRVR